MVETDNYWGKQRIEYYEYYNDDAEYQKNNFWMVTIDMSVNKYLLKQQQYHYLTMLHLLPFPFDLPLIFQLRKCQRFGLVRFTVFLRIDINIRICSKILLCKQDGGKLICMNNYWRMIRWSEIDHKDKQNIDRYPIVRITNMHSTNSRSNWFINQINKSVSGFNTNDSIFLIFIIIKIKKNSSHICRNWYDDIFLHHEISHFIYWLIILQRRIGLDFVEAQQFGYNDRLY